ncbi:pentapeptide repeat-containing protein [Actinoplanes sp. CA-252034]|uniref:pentapeptide repeat-containing protein n=1 Tax=Actinoplanes sp. CA-252034 TaxID=3239906 RepID=UPI003D993FE7
MVTGPRNQSSTGCWDSVAVIFGGVRSEGCGATVGSGAGSDGAALVGASLDGAALVGASLDGAALVGASLEGAVLDGVSLEGAVPVGVSLDGAALDGVSLDGCAEDGTEGGAGFDGVVGTSTGVGGTSTGADVAGMAPETALLPPFSLYAFNSTIHGLSAGSASVLDRAEASTRTRRLIVSVP